MDISVVIPAHNEEGNLAPLVAEIDEALAPHWNYEILIVDDGSSDGTAEELAQIAAIGSSPLRRLRHPRACGQSTALLSGIANAKAAWIATLDADGQNDPADIPALFRRALEGDEAVTMIAGWRAERHDSWVRRLSSKIANGVRSSMLKDATPDTGCGLKVFQRDVFLRLPYFDHMHRFMPALFQREGGKVENVKVNHRPRLHGDSKYGIGNRLWVGIVDLFGVRWLIKRYRMPERVEELTDNETE